MIYVAFNNIQFNVRVRIPADHGRVCVLTHGCIRGQSCARGRRTSSPAGRRDREKRTATRKSIMLSVFDDNTIQAVVSVPS